MHPCASHHRARADGGLAGRTVAAAGSCRTCWRFQESSAPSAAILSKMGWRAGDHHLDQCLCIPECRLVCLVWTRRHSPLHTRDLSRQVQTGVPVRVMLRLRPLHSSVTLHCLQLYIHIYIFTFIVAWAFGQGLGLAAAELCLEVQGFGSQHLHCVVDFRACWNQCRRTGHRLPRLAHMI